MLLIVKGNERLSQNTVAKLFRCNANSQGTQLVFAFAVTHTYLHLH